MVTTIQICGRHRLASAVGRTKKQNSAFDATEWIGREIPRLRKDSFVLVQLIQSLLNDVHDGLEFFPNCSNQNLTHRGDLA